MAVSATRATIEWVLALPGMTGLVVDRVWDRIEADPEFPFVVVQEIGGGDTNVAPVIRPYMQIDVYDDDDPGVADDLAGIITDACRKKLMVKVPGEDVTVMKANWVAKRRVEEPGTGWERWAIDLLITIREDTYTP